MRPVPTAAIAAGSLIGGYGVAAGSGSRPLGGLVLAAGGLYCASVWARRDGPRTAAALTGVGLLAFALSHVIAREIGAWPSVLSVAAATSAVVWVRSDAPAVARAQARA
ncbi:MAG TPA: hypothetical protein VNV44_10125 [Solirubrobacteraceae bacterium]|jgi:hypothetical protein|nr:hypothetical protein [Solirubrobacteraceae bacterium]